MTQSGKPIHLAFERDCIDLPLDVLHRDKVLPAAIKTSVKYRQIRASIQTLGLVEAIVVVPDAKRTGNFIVLDGHLRLEALSDLGQSTARCLISTDDESYTYKKRVNRLSVVQEHRMILRAAESGTSVARLAAALGLSEDSIRQRFRLLNGICNEAIALLADKPATRGMFNALRQMKPFRQIDVAQAMINLNNYSFKLALAMLHRTSPDQLVEEAAAKSQQSGASETLRRLERELASVQADTRLLDESYGPANLELMIIKTYIKSRLENVSVVKWLAKHKPEYLQQLQLIADIENLATD